MQDGPILTTRTESFQQFEAVSFLPFDSLFSHDLKKRDNVLRADACNKPFQKEHSITKQLKKSK
jgi:hypothetical protein